MSILTQGTHIFMVAPKKGDPTEREVIRIRKVTQFNPGSSPADQIDDTDLDDTEAKRSRKGLRTPGQATAQVKATPGEASHIRLAELAESDAPDDERLEFYVGWSDGTAAPTLEGDEVVLPTTRTFYAFEGYVADFPFDFASNTTVVTALAIQRVGSGRWIRKAGA